MTTPFPPPLKVLDPLYIPKDASLEDAVILLQRKVDQATRLVHSFVQYQESLMGCIARLQEKHEEERRGYFSTWSSRQLLERVQRDAARINVDEDDDQPALGDRRKLEVYHALTPFITSGSAVPSPFLSQTSEVPSDLDVSCPTLSLKVEKATTTLGELLEFINNPPRTTLSSDFDDICPDPSQYGCFKTLAANCYIIRRWENMSSKDEPLLAIHGDINAEAEVDGVIDTTGSMTTGTSRESIPASVEPLANKLPMPSPSLSRSISPKAPGPQAENAPTDPGLVDMNRASEPVPRRDLNTPRQAYTFSLSVSLPAAKTLEDLTREDAINILQALPLNVSFCTEHISDDSGQTKDTGAATRSKTALELDGRRVLLGKDRETGRWSVHKAAQRRSPSPDILASASPTGFSEPSQKAASPAGFGKRILLLPESALQPPSPYDFGESSNQGRIYGRGGPYLPQFEGPLWPCSQESVKSQHDAPPAALAPAGDANPDAAETTTTSLSAKADQAEDEATTPTRAIAGADAEVDHAKDEAPTPTPANKLQKAKKSRRAPAKVEPADAPAQLDNAAGPSGAPNPVRRSTRAAARALKSPVTPAAEEAGPATPARDVRKRNRQADTDTATPTRDEAARSSKRRRVGRK